MLHCATSLHPITCAGATTTVSLQMYYKATLEQLTYSISSVDRKVCASHWHRIQTLDAGEGRCSAECCRGGTRVDVERSRRRDGSAEHLACKSYVGLFILAPVADADLRSPIKQDGAWKGVSEQKFIQGDPQPVSKLCWIHCKPLGPVVQCKLGLGHQSDHCGQRVLRTNHADCNLW